MLTSADEMVFQLIKATVDGSLTEAESIKLLRVLERARPGFLAEIDRDVRASLARREESH